MARESDGELIGRSLDEPQAFEVVFDRHYDAIRLYAQRLVGETDGEEIAAQAFEVAFEHRAKFEGERYVSAYHWLLGIVNNLLRHYYRRERVRRQGNARVPPELDQPFDYRPEAEDARRQRAEIHAALAQLSDADRETFALYALGQLPYEEVAQLLGLPIGTVRSRINRARGILRELISPEEAMNERRE